MAQKRTSNGAPSVNITFPGGHKDTLILKKFYANEEEKKLDAEQCNYSGHLFSEPEACIAMTGCVGHEDVEFTIFSRQLNQSYLFKWNKEGNVEVLDDFSQVCISMLVIENMISIQF